MRELAGHPCGEPKRDRREERVVRSDPGDAAADRRRQEPQEGEQRPEAGFAPHEQVLVVDHVGPRRAQLRAGVVRERDREVVRADAEQGAGLDDLQGQAAGRQARPRRAVVVAGDALAHRSPERHDDDRRGEQADERPPRAHETPARRHDAEDERGHRGRDPSPARPGDDERGQPRGQRRETQPADPPGYGRQQERSESVVLTLALERTPQSQGARKCNRDPQDAGRGVVHSDPLPDESKGEHEYA